MIRLQDYPATQGENRDCNPAIFIPASVGATDATGRTASSAPLPRVAPPRRVRAVDPAQVRFRLPQRERLPPPSAARQMELLSIYLPLARFGETTLAASECAASSRAGRRPLHRQPFRPCPWSLPNLHRSRVACVVSPPRCVPRAARASAHCGSCGSVRRCLQLTRCRCCTRTRGSRAARPWSTCSLASRRKARSSSAAWQTHALPGGW